MTLTEAQKKVLEDALAKKGFAENEYKKSISQLNNIVVAIAGKEGGEWEYKNGELIIIDIPKLEVTQEEPKPEESK